MANRSRVAVLRVTPSGILSDIDRLLDLASVSSALASGHTTILKDNISWHFPFPAANTTPWQLEGTILGLARRGDHEKVRAIAFRLLELARALGKSAGCPVNKYGMQPVIDAGGTCVMLFMPDVLAAGLDATLKDWPARGGAG